jgi:Aspartyl/Asparaginyl beta-hydroxylase
MLLDVPFRRMTEVDLAVLERAVAKLAPLYDPITAPLWTKVADRMQYVGKEERPADVGFRKMRPEGYMQLCVENDEHPHSPWAFDIDETVLTRNEQTALRAQYTGLCEGLYGRGTLYYLGFAVLAPGGIVPMHRDMPHDQNKKLFSHHLHIPITGAADAEFTLQDTKVFFEPGIVYEIDNISPHAVVHRGAGFRVNLMIDYCPLDNIDQRNAPSPKVD